MAESDRLLEHAKNHFAPGENALASVLSAYEIKLMGSDSTRNGISIATNQRLLFYAKKLIGFALASVPFGNISCTVFAASTGSDACRNHHLMPSQ